MLRQDPKLPFVAMAWTPGRMAAMLNRHVLPALWPGHLAAEVAIETMTYVPGQQCVAVYHLGKDAPAPGASKRVVVTFAGEEALAQAALREPNPADRSRRAAAATAMVVPQYGCLVEVFPTDCKLPGLARATQLATAAALAPGLAADLGHAASGCQAEIHVLRYRPHQRCVLEYALRSPDRTRLRARLVGKIYPPGPAAAQACQLLDNLGSADLPCETRVPKARGIIDDCNLVLMERASGVSIKHVIESGGAARAVECGALAAATLSALHGLGLGSAPVRTVRDEAAKLGQRAAPLTLVAPELADDVIALLERIAPLTAELPVGAPCFIHGEYKPSQLLIDQQGRMTAVDFDDARLGDPAIDVGTFMAELHRAALRTRQGELRQLASHFFAAYQARRPTAGLARRAVLMQSLALVRMAVRSFQRAPYSYGRKGPASRPAQLLREARHCLPRA